MPKSQYPGKCRKYLHHILKSVMRRTTPLPPAAPSDKKCRKTHFRYFNHAPLYVTARFRRSPLFL